MSIFKRKKFTSTPEEMEYFNKQWEQWDERKKVINIMYSQFSCPYSKDDIDNIILKLVEITQTRYLRDILNIIADPDANEEIKKNVEPLNNQYGQLFDLLRKAYAIYDDTKDYETMVKKIMDHADYGERNPVDIGVDCGYSEEELMGMVDWIKSKEGTD